MSDVRRRSTWSEIGRLGASTLAGGRGAGGGLADQAYRVIFGHRDEQIAAPDRAAADGSIAGSRKTGSSIDGGSAVVDDANPLSPGVWAYQAALAATATGASFTNLALRVRDGANTDAGGSPGPPYRFGSETSVHAAISGTYTSYGVDSDLYAEIDTQDTDGVLSGITMTIEATLIIPFAV